MIAAAVAATFLCASPVATDGDSLRCTDGTRVRLYAIDAPEMHGCRGRKGRVCVKGNPVTARDNLRSLIGPRVVCEIKGVSYDRIVGRCTSRGVDLSCAQVRAGYAVATTWDGVTEYRRCRK